MVTGLGNISTVLHDPCSLYQNIALLAVQSLPYCTVEDLVRQPGAETRRHIDDTIIMVCIAPLITGFVNVCARMRNGIMANKRNCMAQITNK